MGLGSCALVEQFVHESRKDRVFVGLLAKTHIRVLALTALLVLRIREQDILFDIFLIRSAQRPDELLVSLSHLWPCLDLLAQGDIVGCQND